MVVALLFALSAVFQVAALLARQKDQAAKNEAAAKELEAFKKEAIERGAARYNPKNGVWEWTVERPLVKAEASVEK
jgi:hypothetical protein